MTDWIALIVSIISLFVSIVVQREKLFSAIVEYKAWRASIIQRKKAMSAIRKIASRESAAANASLRLSPAGLYLPVFSLSVISSIVLSYFAGQPYSYITFPLGTGIYFIISLTVLFVFILIYRKQLAHRGFELSVIVGIVSAILVFSAWWGVCAVIIAAQGFSTLVTGILAGLILMLRLWFAVDNANRRSKKPRNQNSEV